MPRLQSAAAVQNSAPLHSSTKITAWILGSPRRRFAPAPPVDDEVGKAPVNPECLRSSIETNDEIRAASRPSNVTTPVHLSGVILAATPHGIDLILAHDPASLARFGPQIIGDCSQPFRQRHTGVFPLQFTFKRFDNRSGHGNLALGGKLASQFAGKRIPDSKVHVTDLGDICPTIYHLS
jgi:hypothetical protein